jgi:hypothetical protein
MAARHCCCTLAAAAPRSGHDEADGRGEQATPPPSNGYGNDDDLYAMGLSLEPAVNTVNLDSHERFLKGDKKVCCSCSCLILK